MTTQMLLWLLLPLTVYAIFLWAWIMTVADYNRRQLYANHVDVYPAPKTAEQPPEPLRWIVLPLEDPKPLEVIRAQLTDISMTPSESAAQTISAPGPVG